jgi:FlaA1/EpsC-like NDP-sugar epimerase
MREIRSSNGQLGNVVCVIDDDSSKVGKEFYGARIVGGRDTIVENSEKFKIDEIFIAVPSASREVRKELLHICSQTSCRIKTLPGIYQLINDEVSIAAMRDVSIQDLLGRDQIELDMSGIYGFLSGKKILVTGAGGSIGSELCRQIAQYNPEIVIGLDIYENSLYDVQQELKRTYGDSLTFRAEIASIRDKEKIYSLFNEIRPDIVFHAAAHKHVPLMENAPDEAIKNNVFGTYHVVRASEKFGVSKFIMISTDKAVNPTNIMGATKRFCEMVLQSRQESHTEFAAVRFGNVLGSNGSVVPLFQKQIEDGGPVTITDKRIIRYFMTIQEACSLVLEAGAMAKQNQVFILDMGDPVKILDLAEEMIRLAGLRPYKDIPIVEIGLRPGEKLYEELLMSRDNLQKTANSKIFIEEQEPLSQEFIMSCLHELDSALENGVNREESIALLRRIIPTYQPPETVNSRVE